MKYICYAYRGRTVKMDWSPANETIAATEADEGAYSIEEDDAVVPPEVSQLDRVEAQAAYTAMMTGTLLEV